MIYVGITAILQFYYMPLNMTANTLFSLSRDPSILSVFGARVLLNLKVEGERSDQQGASIREKTTMRSIVYAEPPSLTANGTQSELSLTDPEKASMAETEATAVEYSRESHLSSVCE